MIGQRLPATLEVDLYAFLLATTAAFVAAVAATYRRRPSLDRGVRWLSYIGLGTPPFWFGLLLLVTLSSRAGIFPGPDGRLSPTATPPPQVTGLYTIDALLAGQWSTFWDATMHLVLPAVTLAFILFAVLARLLRANLLGVEREHFLLVVKSKGVARWPAFVRHAVPNAILPTMTAAGLLLAELLTGSVLVESVFNWPGVGGLIVNSIQRKDYAVVQAFILLVAIAYVVVNAVVDLLYILVDPRTRLPAAAHMMNAAVQTATLSVRNLHATFTTKTEVVYAVRGVDLDVAQGERLALVGESGCGKSALALSIAGLLEPPGRVEEGEIWLGGRDLTTLRERDLQRIRGKDVGVVFQDALTGLDPVKTVGSQISESLRAHDRSGGRAAARRRSVELLSEVGITSPERRVHDYPHQFSGGMRQRVMIAMAIANEPQLLIADEPTTALDVTTQAQILRLLARMAENHGCAVIFITHDLGIVAGFCDSRLCDVRRSDRRTSACRRGLCPAGTPLHRSAPTRDTSTGRESSAADSSRSAARHPTSPTCRWAARSSRDASSGTATTVACTMLRHQSSSMTGGLSAPNVTSSKSDSRH